MTLDQYQKAYGQQLKELLQSPLGQATLIMVNSMKPNYDPSPHEHIFIENRGAVRGYDLCIRNLAGLTFVPVVKTEVQQDYGVKDSEPKDQPPVPVYSPTQVVTTETQV